MPADSSDTLVAPGEISYQLTASELFRTALRQKLLRPRFLVAAGVGLAGSLLLMSAGREPERTLGAWFLVMVLLTLGMIVAGLWVAVRRSPVLLAPRTLRFDEHEIALATPDVKASYAWSCFGRRWVQAGYVYLEMAGGGAAIVIPRAAFDDARWERFARFAGIAGTGLRPRP